MKTRGLLGVTKILQRSTEVTAELHSCPGRRLLRGSLPVLLGRRFVEAACVRAVGKQILAKPCAIAALQPDHFAAMYSNESSKFIPDRGTPAPKVIDISNNKKGVLRIW